MDKTVLIILLVLMATSCQVHSTNVQSPLTQHNSNLPSDELVWVADSGIMYSNLEQIKEEVLFMVPFMVNGQEFLMVQKATPINYDLLEVYRNTKSCWINQIYTLYRVPHGIIKLREDNPNKRMIIETSDDVLVGYIPYECLFNKKQTE